MLISLVRLDWPVGLKLLLLLAMTLSATFSIVLHEIGHSSVALLFGDATAKKAGRLSPNPLKHFDLYGYILLVTMGFGWAKPVPINPNNFRRPRAGIIAVSLAGIIVNLLLLALNLVVLHFAFPFLNACMISPTRLKHFGFFANEFLEYMVILNAMLAFFNILPIAPLDGFNVVNMLLPQGNAYSAFMQKYGWAALIGILIVSCVLDIAGLSEYNAFYQVQNLALRLIGLATGQAG